jgi:hypothetical protein
VKVLVTGAGGNLGRVVVPALVDAGHTPRLVDARAIDTQHDFGRPTCATSTTCGARCRAWMRSSTPLPCTASIWRNESHRFNRALADYRQVVDQCKLQAP